MMNNNNDSCVRYCSALKRVREPRKHVFLRFRKQRSMYTQPATGLTPALVIYLLDASDSMNEPCGAASKIDLVNQTLRAAIKDMVRRSMRDGMPQKRYRLAVFAYSTTPIDVLGGIHDLPELLQ